MDNHKTIIVTKASGEQEPFDINKLERSLKNAGTSDETIAYILKEITAWIYPGVSTKHIFKKAFSYLKKDQETHSVKYKLKQAFLELGDTGYPFERIIGELFERQGYQCEVGIVVSGCCITHEMDVIATKENIQHLMECKYRLDQGKHINIQVPLYVHSRVNDIAKYRQVQPEFRNFTFTPWVVTNTRFSPDSEAYSKCSGIRLLGWDYPAGEGLKDLVEKYQLYPVSILVNLTAKEKQSLLNAKVVTCKQLLQNLAALDQLELTEAKRKKIIKELKELCHVAC